MTETRPAVARPAAGIDRWLADWRLAVGLFAAAVAVIGLRFAGAAADDIYITYRYAANFAAGRGLIFNPGERVFGLSDPGAAVLLGGIHRLLAIPIPVAGTALTAAALLAIALQLWSALKTAGRAAEGLLAGVLVASSPYLWLGQGAGPLPSLALILLASRTIARRPALAGALAGAAVACRPDALLAAGALGLISLRRNRAAAPSRFFAALALALGVVASALWWAFGTLLPNTLAAKRLFAGQAPASFRDLAFWRAAFDLGRQLYGPLWWALLAGSAGGLVLLCRARARELLLLGVSALLLASLYTLAGVPFFAWYMSYPLVAVLAGAALAFGNGLRFLLAAPGPRRLGCLRRRLGLVAGAAALLGTVVLGWTTARWFAQEPSDWRLRAYRWAGSWIRAHSAPADWIAYDEVGILGYYSERPILDLVGLVSPSSLPYTAAGDLLGAFLQHPTRFVVQHTYDQRGGTRPITFRPWFALAYREVARWSDAAQPGGMLIYERVEPRAIPPPRPPVLRTPRARAPVRDG
ncbi:MAG TPA: hypothetical protein VHR45_08955 [Thermoanaerobaculia bacterium]|nr:hypothetical protein [Thermoanaerobaculia bacterium]